MSDVQNNSESQVCVNMLENSDSQICVYVMNISILLICVKHTEYLRVSSLCLMRRTYQKTRSVSAMLKVHFFVLYFSCGISQVLRSVSVVLNISELEFCV